MSPKYPTGWWRAGKWRAMIAGTAAGGAIALAGCSAATGPAASQPQAAPVCSQVQASATPQGAALGHAGVLFTLKNTGQAGCRLDGYPGLQLIGSGGRHLPTTVVPARHGAYLFAATAPREVTVQPGHAASFDLQYGNSPVGARAAGPAAGACPPASSVWVNLPGGAGHPVVRGLSIAPCDGQVMVSPVVQGTHWLTPR